ncbi:MAG: glycoside hydrolase family 43 protein [Lysobacterales bacterium]|nr:MAG: glycoside hydrolase family 43 protein [Xanthomonadales bacterium]
MVRNPILRGFNPDPSICRVGDDYFIATSTFEWYPGVQIHHSRDLANWRLRCRPLDRPALLDLAGVPDSCGVWAPCLSWHDGLFWLCYSVVFRFDGNFKDTHNYLTTARSIDGEWADPVYLNSSGFDPSLYHAEDGRKWYLNMVWDHRPDRTFFGGITLQEYSSAARRLVGSRKFIFDGSRFGCTEGPHLYRFDDYFYLMTAEGGTGYEHVVTMARSKNIGGPYELDPGGPIVTSRHAPEHPLQRAGHGDLVDSPDGRHYLVHLCSRPLPGTRRSPMGRETAIQEVERTDEGWFRLVQGGQLPALEVVMSARECGREPGMAGGEATDCQRDTFDRPVLPAQYQWLRSSRPADLFSLEERPGYLRLFGRESLGSLYHQALVARRQQHFSYQAETEIWFEPEHFQQMAGLVCYYNSSKFHYLYISRDDEVGKHLAVMSCSGELSLNAQFPNYWDRVPVPENRPLFLRVRVDRHSLVFSWSADGDDWLELPLALDASVLCDEAGKGEGAHFTGAFVGMCCQDLAGTRLPADFARFSYRALDAQS